MGMRPATSDPVRYRFGVFEADAGTGELRRAGLRVKLHDQPMQVLLLLVGRPGEVLTREELARALWPDGVFVDFEQGVNSAVNRLRDALGDSARNPRFVETLARRGYRFVAPVERLDPAPKSELESESSETQPHQLTRSVSIQTPPDTYATFGSMPTSAEGRWLPTAAHLPRLPPRTTAVLYLLFQAMYVAFYVGALANLSEIEDLLSPLPANPTAFAVVLISAALLIPVRAYLVCAALLHPPGVRTALLRLWPFTLAADLLWSLAPFLLLHHISAGLALACTALLVYAPFAQRSLLLMGAVDPANDSPDASS